MSVDKTIIELYNQAVKNKLNLKEQKLYCTGKVYDGFNQETKDFVNDNMGGFSVVRGDI